MTLRKGFSYTAPALFSFLVDVSEREYENRLHIVYNTVLVEKHETRTEPADIMVQLDCGL